MFRSFLDHYEESQEFAESERHLLFEERMLQVGLARGDWDLWGLPEMAQHTFKSKTPEGQTKEESVYDIPKCPIFFDKQDIDFLLQFPPCFWRQAMEYRYNNLPVEIKKEVTQGREFNAAKKSQLIRRWRWIPIHRDQKVQLYFVDCNPEKLWTKFTKDFGGEMLRDMDIHPDNQEEMQAAMQAYFAQHGAYGFTFNDPQEMIDIPEEEEEAKPGMKKVNKKRKSSTPPPWVTRDYVGQTRESLTPVIQRWVDAVQDGWLGETKKDGVQLHVNFGGGAPAEAPTGEGKAWRNKKTMYCREPQWISHHVAKWGAAMRHHLESYGIEDLVALLGIDEQDLEANGITVNDLLPKVAGGVKKTETGQEMVGNPYAVRYKSIRQDGETIEVYETAGYVPVLYPGKLVDSKASVAVMQYRESLKQIESAKAAGGGYSPKFDEILKDLLDVKLEDKVQKKLDEIEAAMQQGEMGEALTQQMDFLASKQSVLVMRQWLVKKYPKLATLNADNISKADKDMLWQLLGNENNYEHEVRKRIEHIIATAKKYDVFDWLMAYHNAKTDPHPSGKGDPVRRFARLYLTTHGFGTLNPNKNQKGMQVGNPDEWEMKLNKYVGYYRTFPGENETVYNYVVDFRREHEMPAEQPGEDAAPKPKKKKKKAGEMGSQTVKQQDAAIVDKDTGEPLKKNGAVIQGIIDCLNRSYVKGQPEYYCLIARAHDVMQYCLAILRYQTGAPEIADFLTAMQGQDEGVDEAEVQAKYVAFERQIRKRAEFLTLSLFQLPFDPVRGSIRLRKKAHKEGTKSHTFSAELKAGGPDESAVQGSYNISDEDKKKMREMAEQVAFAQSLRTYRPSSSGWQDFFGASIKGMYDHNKNLRDKLNTQIAMQSFGEKGKEIMYQNLTYLQQDLPIFIWYHSHYIMKYPDSWTPEKASEYAFQMLLKTQKHTGIGKLNIGLFPTGAAPSDPGEQAASAQKKAEFDAAMEEMKKAQDQAIKELYPRLDQIFAHTLPKKAWTPAERLLMLYFQDLEDLQAKGDAPSQEEFAKTFSDIEHWVVQGIPGGTLMFFRERLKKETGEIVDFTKEEFKLRMMFGYVCKKFGKEFKMVGNSAQPQDQPDSESQGSWDQSQGADYLIAMWVSGANTPMSAAQCEAFKSGFLANGYTITDKTIKMYANLPQAVKSHMEMIASLKQIASYPAAQMQLLPLFEKFLEAIDKNLPGPIFVPAPGKPKQQPGQPVPGQQQQQPAAQQPPQQPQQQQQIPPQQQEPPAQAPPAA